MAAFGADKALRVNMCLGNDLTRSEDVAEDAALENKLQAMGTPELKALHEASTFEDKQRKQAVVVITSRLLSKGQTHSEAKVGLSALNGVTGSLVFGPQACKHAFLQHEKRNDYLLGAVLLVFSPVVTLQKGDGKYKQDCVHLYVNKQTQVMHIGYARDIERCGALTKQGSKCMNIVNRVNGAF